jgi:hypothetical protein
VTVLGSTLRSAATSAGVRRRSGCTSGLTIASSFHLHIAGAIRRTPHSQQRFTSRW